METHSGVQKKAYELVMQCLEPTTLLSGPVHDEGSLPSMAQCSQHAHTWKGENLGSSLAPTLDLQELNSSLRAIGQS